MEGVSTRPDLPPEEHSCFRPEHDGCIKWTSLVHSLFFNCVLSVDLCIGNAIRQIVGWLLEQGVLFTEPGIHALSKFSVVWKADLQIFGRIRKDLEIFVQPLLPKVVFFTNKDMI